MPNRKQTKSKICNWCNKRKLKKNMYHLGVFENTKKLINNGGFVEAIKDNTDYWICDKCNLKHDVV